MSEKDSDLKAREEGAEAAALREIYGRAPGAWGDSIGTPPASLREATQPVTLVPGRGRVEPGKVISTWAVRPANALDYNAIFQRWVVDSASFPFPNVLGSCYFRVPGGYVATVERVTYYATIAMAAVFPPYDDTTSFGQASGLVFVELFFNGSPQGLFRRETPPFSDWASGFATTIKLPTLGRDVPCFFVAPPDTLIELRFMIGLGAVNNITHGFVSFGGVLRETRGLSPNFEVNT